MSRELIPYAVGIVTKDAAVGSREAEIFPLEKFPGASGSLTEPEEKTGEYEDALKAKNNYTLKKSNSLTATWLPWQAYNRITAPTLCKGEYVLLYKYRGEDSYYWIPFFTETRLRKKEQVTNFYSNKTKIMEADDENLAKRGYFTTIDTIAKFCHLHTDKNAEAEEDKDKEKAGYDLTLNGGEGFAKFEDTETNVIKLSSVEGHLDVTLQGNLTMKLEDKSPNGEESDKGNIEITNKGNTNITTEKAMKIKVTKNIEAEFDKIKLSNGADELITLLVNLIQEVMDMMHMGNQGAPTKIHPASQAKLQQLKTKFEAFKV